MKRLKYIFCFTGMLLLAGCFEINEDINIFANGKGVYSVHNDMSQLLEAMSGFLGKDEMDKQMPSKNIDTTILIKNLVDTAKNISAENKELLRDGTVRLVLNMDKKEFKTDIIIPFKSQSDLQKLVISMNNQSLGFSQIFKGIAGKPDTANSGNDNGLPDINQFNSIYDFVSHDGLISRKLNPEKWKALQESPQFAQMKEAANMGISIPYTLTIVVPRPVKKIDNPLAKLVPDRKKVIIQYNLIEVFEHPENFDYTIVY